MKACERDGHPDEDVSVICERRFCGRCKRWLDEQITTFIFEDTFNLDDGGGSAYALVSDQAGVASDGAYV